MIWTKGTASGSAAATKMSGFGAVQVIDAKKAIRELSQEHCEFDSFMMELEADEANADHFEKADSWIANTFYGGDIMSMRAIRERKGITQAALADMVGTSQPQIARIEKGQSDPQLSTVLRLAASLGVDANTICAALGAQIVSKAWSTR